MWARLFLSLPLFLSFSMWSWISCGSFRGMACECQSFSLGAICLLVWDSISYCPEPYQTGRADNWSVSPRKLTASTPPQCWDEKQGWLQLDFKCTYSFLIMCVHARLCVGMCTWVQVLWRLEEGRRYPGAGITMSHPVGMLGTEF